MNKLFQVQYHSEIILKSLRHGWQRARLYPVDRVSAEWFGGLSVSLCGSFTGKLEEFILFAQFLAELACIQTIVMTSLAQ